MDYISEIRKLKEEKRALILAHNYQVPEIQDVADFIGDSLDLSKKARESDAEIIVFCGVEFMAEVAKILSPEKKVLIPEKNVGCSLADSIKPSDIVAWKRENPDGIVVSYINTTAEVKTLSDYICTSANAPEVLGKAGNKEILFVPDRNLGYFSMKRVNSKDVHLWPGSCHVHQRFTLSRIMHLLEKYPEAEFFIHPESDCVPVCLNLIKHGVLPENRLFFLSTGGMVKRARETSAEKIVVATETGIIYRLQKENPNKIFIPADESAICEYMKKITIEKLYRSLKEEVYEVVLDKGIIEKARRALEKMF